MPMNHCPLWFAVALVGSASAGSSLLATDDVRPATVTEDPVVAAIVDDIGKREMEAEGAVGISIGVAKGDAVLCTRGFGRASVELDVPTSSDTAYRIGSLTKQFTAAAILLLVEDGKIELDATLDTYLPDYPDVAEKITIEHLLRHTSGLVDFTGLPAYRRERALDVTREEVLSRFRDLDLEFEPGTRHRYSNSGYVVLALVVEKVSGTTYEKFVEERIFDRSKLSHTVCDRPGRIVPNRAAGYTFWRDQLRRAPHVSTTHALGAGNLVSTVGDLLRWQQSLAGGRLLKPASVRAMTTAGRLKDGRAFDYGFGVRVRTFEGTKVVRHAGGISGYRAELAHYPETGYTIAVLANSQNVDCAKVASRLARRLLKVESHPDPR